MGFHLLGNWYDWQKEKSFPRYDLHAKFRVFALAPWSRSIILSIPVYLSTNPIIPPWSSS